MPGKDEADYVAFRRICQEVQFQRVWDSREEEFVYCQKIRREAQRIKQELHDYTLSGLLRFHNLQESHIAVVINAWGDNIWVLLHKNVTDADALKDELLLGPRVLLRHALLVMRVGAEENFWATG